MGWGGGTEAHGGSAALICTCTGTECALKLKAGLRAETHAGKDEVHVTNLLRYIQNPVIELYPDLFLQEEGCCVKITRGHRSHREKPERTCSLRCNTQHRHGKTKLKATVGKRKGVVPLLYLAFLLHSSRLSARRVPDGRT